MIRSDRLHYHDTGNRQLSVVTTVNQDSDGLIQRQITQYNNACAFQVTVGHPSTACLKYIIQGNIIANFPVIVQDIVKNIWRSLVSPQGYHQYSVPEEHQKQIPRDIRQWWLFCIHSSQTQWDVGPIWDAIIRTTLPWHWQPPVFHGNYVKSGFRRIHPEIDRSIQDCTLIPGDRQSPNHIISECGHTRKPDQ